MQIEINKQAVEASFSKAAAHYDHFADLQRDIGFTLMELMPTKAASAQHILDLGCGTGYFSEQLHLYTRNAALTCFDLSPAMLMQTKNRKIHNCSFLKGDIDQFPIAKIPFDLVFSNLVLQWSNQLDLCLTQLRKSFNNKTTFAFSTLLAGSLFELKTAWESIDSDPHINQFLTVEAVQAALKKSGFIAFKLVTETRIKKFKNVLSIMKALKGIGANHVHRNKKHTSSSKQLIATLEKAYQPFVDQNGDYNLTYQVCYVVTES